MPINTDVKKLESERNEHMKNGSVFYPFIVERFSKTCFIVNENKRIINIVTFIEIMKY